MKYGFIGCGNMGGAIAKALSKVTTDFMITDRSGKAKDLAHKNSPKLDKRKLNATKKKAQILGLLLYDL